MYIRMLAAMQSKILLSFRIQLLDCLERPTNQTINERVNEIHF